TITAYYNLTGLYPNTEYKIYNGSELIYTQYTDSQGNLEFNLTITTTSRNITVQYQNCEEVIYYLPYTINKNNTYYCLESDKYIADQTAITFASGVQNSTLDCLGYNISNAMSNYGIYLAGSTTKNNTIKNCNVEHFNIGFYIFSSSNNTFLNNSAQLNYNGFYLNSSSNNTFLNNSAIFNINFGFYLNSSSNNTFISNTANSNYHGFFLSSSSNNTFTNNTASSNYDYGFYLYFSSNNTFTNNSASSNGNAGFFLNYSSNNSFTNNIANSNYYGFRLDSSSSNTLINNTANSNTLGFSLFSNSNSNSFINNSANFNYVGFYLGSSFHNSLSQITTYNNTYGIYLDSSNFTILSNITTYNNSENGITLDSSSNNSLSQITTYNNTYGIYLYSSSNNNITGGSFHSNTNYDYYLRSAGSTNNFTQTNFTAPRKIYFYDTTSWFNYNNRTDIELWLKTRVSAATIITRKLISWEKSLMIWNDTNSSGTEITANYNITGLNPNKYYLIYNNSVLTYTLQADSSGSLSFTIYLSSEHEIKVEEDTQAPQYSLNSTNSTIAGSAVSHNLFWQDNIGLSYAIFSFDNCTGEFQNISEMSLSGTQAWTNFTVTINETIGCTIRWKVYANDSSNNWNETEVFSYTTTSPSPCQQYISSCSELNLANTYYCLNQSILDSSSTACINISANNITLDCLGNTIDGNDTSSTYGINISRGSSQNTNITVKNCIVTDWSYGIYLRRAKNNTFLNNTANSNSYGFYLESDSNYNSFINNTANSNSNTGFYIYYYSNYNSFINNSANSNSDTGFYIYYYSNYNSFINNSANSNSRGFYIYSSSYTTLTNNFITSYHNSTHKQQGLFITGSSISHFYHNISESNLINDKPILYQDSIYNPCTNNTIFTNGSSYSYMGFVNCFNITVKDSSPSEGILLAGTNNSTISNLNISYSRYPFYLFSSSYNTFTNNTANSNSIGFYLDSNSNYNTFINNSANSNYYDGFYLESNSNYNTFINNTANSNSDTGFQLFYSSFNILTNNILTNNRMVGIYMCDSDSNTISNNTINLSTYGMRFNPGFYNKVFDNYITSNTYGIEIEDSSEGNNFTNNLINFNSFGFYALSFYYNNVTGGSILSTGYDYYFFSPLGPETNYFRNTNFTAPRKISFTVTPAWFNYNNRTDLELWLKTSVSSSSTLTRNLFSWTKALIKWQEQSSTTITAYYNLTGLYPNTEYKIYNGSELIYTQYTDSQGNLEFNLTITTTSRNITVQYQNCEEVIYYLPYTINKNNTYYCLESDKYIADQTAITFASGVQNSTLDCLGYNLDSNDVYTNYGVYLTSNTKNNTIKNCKITDFGYGIYLEYSSNNTLINNSASSNKDEGFRLYNSSNNTLINNSASSNIQGFYLYYNSNYNTLINNSANLNSDEDFYLEISYYNILLNNTAASNCDRGFYLESSSYNTLSNNIAKSNYHGFFLYFSSNNTLINNTAISNSYGFLLGYSSNNTITGGSIALSSIAEYYLSSAGSTNNFTATNFTAPRKIYFSDSESWFNYNNRTDLELWLKTRVSAATTITRKLISWEKSLMIWNDSSSSAITAFYNISGLNPNKYYLIYNNSVLTYTLQSDSSGSLSFTIYLSGESEIKVQEEEAPQYSNNKTFPISPTIYEQGKTYQFNITCTDNSGITSAWLTFNGTIYQMSNQSSEYYITLADLPAGSYYYNFTCNDTFGITNTTPTLLYKIEKAKPVLTISNATYSVNTSGLVGYWRFEEGSGNLAKDSSGYDNDGTLYNNPTWQEGRFGNSVNLNGINQYINLSNSSSLSTLSFTLSLWVKLNSDPNCDGLNNWRSFARKGSTAGTSTGWDIVLEDDRSLQFDIGNGTSWQNRLRTSAGIVPVNEWVHLVFVYDSVKNTTKIYKNGTLVASRSIIGLMVPNTQPILLSGGTNSSSCPYQSGYVNGSFDEVKIYNRTLNEDEIKMLYQNEVTYKTQTNFSCFSNTQQVTPSLYRNTTLVSNPDVQNLTAGYYYYLCNASETQNYTQSAILAPLKVSPGFISLTFSPELTKGIFYTNLTGSLLNIQFNVDINAWNNATWNYNATDKKTEYWIRNDGTYEVDICQKASSNMLCYDECANPSYEIYIGNVSWSNSTLNDEANPSFSTLYPLTLDYSENKSAYSLAPGQYLYLRFWLFVPSYVPSGKYNTSIIFKAVEAGNSC
ncbi:MAG: right-handed parallel beta-helix repeat-containing protein, partial [Candidatus Aenigmatarchaeota archaeon]